MEWLRLLRLGCNRIGRSPTVGFVTITNVLTAIGLIVLILQAASQIPVALAELLRACKQVLAAVRELLNSDQS